MSSEEKRQRVSTRFDVWTHLYKVEDVIKIMNLTKSRNTIVGGPFRRGEIEIGIEFEPLGISGGERKRVSIGNEMLSNPGIMLLDEPTSGLVRICCILL